MKMSVQMIAGIARMKDIVPRKMKLKGNGVTRSEPSVPKTSANGNPRGPSRRTPSRG